MFILQSYQNNTIFIKTKLLKVNLYNYEKWINGKVDNDYKLE